MQTPQRKTVGLVERPSQQSKKQRKVDSVDWIILGICYLAWAWMCSRDIEVNPNNKKHKGVILWVASLTWPLWVGYAIYKQQKA
jgi:hypothetical protein